MVLWKFDKYSPIFNSLIPKTFNNYIKIIFLIILIGSFGVLLYQLIKFQMNKKLFKSLSLKSASISTEIDWSKKSDISYFDENLDDILYLFDNCQCNIIVFEDLDRYETYSIFESLREINTLINKKRELHKDKLNNRHSKSDFNKLIFLYLIKDEMFVSKERTKFFDLIIPVIPTVTSSNSGEKFLEVLTELGCKDDFDGNFLQKLSIYVDDMRLINNICNEYIVYNKYLIDNTNKTNPNADNLEENKDIKNAQSLKESIVANKLNLDKKKLFAIIVYKNICPKDFSLLQSDSGFIYSLFDAKKQLIKEKIIEIDNEINNLEQKLEDAEKEALENELELYSSVIKIPNDRIIIKVNGKQESEFENHLDFIEEILDKNSTIQSYTTPYNLYLQQGERNETIKSLFPSIEDDDFQNRLNNIQNKSSISSFREDILSLQNVKAKERKMKLAELISVKVINKIIDESKKEFEYLKVDNKHLMIQFLVKNGFIDESYPEYITFFYPNSLRKEDKEFIIAVQGGEKLPWVYPLINIQEVYNRLSVQEFESDEILNYDLFDFILNREKSELNNDIITRYFNESRLVFLIEFLIQASRESKDKFALNFKKFDLLNYLIDSTTISVENKSIIIQCILLYREINKDYLSDTQIDNLASFISKNWETIWLVFDQQEDALRDEDGLIGDDQEVDKDFIGNYFLDNLSYIDVKINHFKFCGCRVLLAKHVYINNLYVLNEYNIFALFNFLDRSIDDSSIRHKNYSIIKSNDMFEELYTYISENFELYVNTYIGFSGGTTCDEEEDRYDILNSDFLEEITKIEYLMTTKEKSLDLSKIEEVSIKDKAIEHNKAGQNTSNILNYFEEKDSWNDTLIAFVNGIPFFLVDNNIFKAQSDFLKRNFFDKTIITNDLKDGHYKSILSVLVSKFNLIVDVFPDGNITNDKMSILIDIGALSTNFEKNILLSLRDRYPEHVMKYNLRYINGYIENLGDDEIYDEAEMLSIISEDIEFANAKKIIDNFQNVINIEDSKFNDEIFIYILDTKFDKNNLEYLIQDFEKFSLTVQKKVKEILSSFIESILNMKFSLSKNLVSSLSKNKNVDIEDRKLLFSRNINLFEKNEVIDHLKSIEMYADYKKIKDELQNHKNPKVINNEYNRNVLEYFKAKKSFSSFTVDTKDDASIRIQSFKKRRKGSSI